MLKFFRSRAITSLVLAFFLVMSTGAVSRVVAQQPSKPGASAPAKAGTMQTAEESQGLACLATCIATYGLWRHNADGSLAILVSCIDIGIFPGWDVICAYYVPGA